MAITTALLSAGTRARRGISAQWHNRRRLTALGRNVEGAAMLEFAFVGPAFIALVLACLHTALVFLAQEGLESAAESASRLLLTGQAQTFQSYTGATVTTGMSAAQFKQAICGTLSYNATANATKQTSYGATMLPPFLSCDRLTVNVTIASSYATATTSGPFTYNASGAITATSTGYATTSGGAGQNLIEVVQLVYLWPTMTGPLGFSLINQSGTANRVLVATQVLSTEVYVCPTNVASC